MASESITCCHFQKKAWGKCGRKPLQLVDFLFFSLLNHLHVCSSVPSVCPSVHPCGMQTVACTQQVCLEEENKEGADRAVSRIILGTNLWACHRGII